MVRLILWRFGIASNLLRHHHRGEARRLCAYSRLDCPRDSDEAFSGIEARLGAERAGPAIAEALTLLLTDERDVLLLFAWADFRYEEIAVAWRGPGGQCGDRRWQLDDGSRSESGASLIGHPIRPGALATPAWPFGWGESVPS